jgi:hypothetical protein
MTASLPVIKLYNRLLQAVKVDGRMDSIGEAAGPQPELRTTKVTK